MHGLCATSTRRPRAFLAFENFFEAIIGEGKRTRGTRWGGKDAEFVRALLFSSPRPDDLLYTESMIESLRLQRLGLATLTAALVAVYAYAAIGPLRAIT